MTIKKALAALTLLPALVGSAWAQPPATTPDLSNAKLDAKLFVRAAHGHDGLSTQSEIHVKNDEFKTVGLYETTTSGDTNAGLDIRWKGFQLNAAHGDREAGDDLERLSLAYEPTHGTFIGGSVVTGATPEDQYVAFGGLQLNDNWRIESAGDNRDSLRGRVLFQGDGYQWQAGAGRDEDHNLVGNVSFNNDYVWANAQFGEKRPLDVRLVIGDIPKKSEYAFSVKDTGLNSLEKYIDQTYKFTMGSRPTFWTNLGTPYQMLGEQAGDFNVDMRYIEEKSVSVNASYRIGDLGPLEESSVTVGTWRDLQADKQGVSGELGTKIFDRVYLRGRIEHFDDTTNMGTAVELRF